MRELFFYDREQRLMMRWFDFSLEKRYFGFARYLHFKVEITISVFSVKTEYDIDAEYVLKFRKNLKLMCDQRTEHIRFHILDEFTNLEFSRNKCGDIRVDIYIADKPHYGNVELSYLSDQLFLPELIESFDEVLRNVLV